MEKLVLNVLRFVASQRGYSSLFKASVVLLSVALVAMSQVGPFLYGRDIEAHKLKFEIESKVGATLSKVDCDRPGPLKADCYIAKYEIATLESTLSLFERIVMLCLKFGAFLGFISIAGFLAAAYRSEGEFGAAA